MKKITDNQNTLRSRGLVNGITTIVFVLFSITIIVSCETTSVLSFADKKKEAERTIVLAKSVDAPKYAPQEFNSAIEYFDNGNRNASQNEGVQAFSNFTTSIDYATNAYLLSLAPYVMDLIDETDRMLIEAIEVIEDVSLFENAAQINREANEEYDAGNYLIAKEKTLEARESIEMAYRYFEEQRKEEDQSQESLIFNKRVLREGEQFYQVKYNPDDRDCLWKIAEREMGNATSWRRLYNRNDDIISDPNLIYPGQNLIVPKINN